MRSDYNICSLVVHLAPARADEAARAVAALPGVEIHAHTDDWRLVVTAVDQIETRAFDQIAEIHRTPGVVAASLVYHAFDTDESGAQSAQSAIQN
ncbi:MAG: chaperone NapD [Hyphomicrobiales bacterium]|nr:chaperone NapD [Hyphomicrobiales bacterium]